MTELSDPCNRTGNGRVRLGHSGFLRYTRSLTPLGFIAIVGCADVLGYDNVSLGDSTGGASASGGTGSSGGNAGQPGNGGGGPPSGGGVASGGGGAPNGGSGAPSGGGSTSGGGSPGGGGAPSGGGGTTATGGTIGSHYETLTNPNGTGNEPGGVIPVCCVPSSTEKSGIDQVFTLLNQHRLANGKSALAYDTKLEAAIEGHAHHMALHSFWGHDAPESAVSSPWVRASLCGTSANGENLGNGYGSPASVMDGWKNSPGHNANMLGDFSRVGIGKYNTYWGQLFGN